MFSPTEKRRRRKTRCGGGREGGGGHGDGETSGIPRELAPSCSLIIKNNIIHGGHSINRREKSKRVKK